MNKEYYRNYMRVWRKTHPLTPEQKKKDNCRSYLGVYVRRGKIKKLACEVCDDINSQSHHDDYNKPLSVRWFCVKHHLEYHKNRCGT